MVRLAAACRAIPIDLLDETPIAHFGLSMKDFTLQQQNPSAEVALKRAEASILQFERSLEQDSDDTTCHCPHLLEYLPDQLDLTFAKSQTRGWMLRNPIHAMHLASQLDPVWLQSLEDPPVLYGDEQERLEAITMEGIPETWHPWTRRTFEDNPMQEEQPCVKEPQKEETTTSSMPAASTDAPQATELPHPEPSSVASASVSEVEPATEVTTTTTESGLSDERLMAMNAQEEHIYSIQDTLLGRRTLSSSSLLGNGTNKKRKEASSTITAGLNSDIVPSSSLSAHSGPASGAGLPVTAATLVPTSPLTHKNGTVAVKERPWAQPIVHFTRADEQAWEYKLKIAQDKVTTWLQMYKNARKSFYAEASSAKRGTQGTTRLKPFFGSDSVDFKHAACQSCRKYSGDDLMQCLECSFVGCYVTKDDEQDVISEHMMEHLVVKNHNFGTSSTRLV